MESTNQSLQKMFMRWLAFSTLALFILAAVPALSADVFIDEGDGDFDPSVMEVPPALPTAPVAAGVVKGPAPASEVPVEDDLGLSDIATDVPLDQPFADQAHEDVVPEISPGVEPQQQGMTKEAPAAAAVAPKKEKATKAAKKEKAAGKKDKAKKSAKAGKKKDGKAKGGKVAKKSKKSAGQTANRSVASHGGGRFATTSKECAMESAPGAGDSVGSTRASRKVWVEDAGNAAYWKVYDRAGQAAYLSRDCF
ncbi:MAG: hypothetical protein RBT63_01045 [Bdellovibrionales bacterium]|nr:hypothetical protein [Bdellovibrionales bacterium]